MPGQLARALGTLDRLDSTITDVIALARDLSRGASTTVAALLADVQRRWHGALAAENRPLRIVASDAGAPAIAISAAASAQILDVLIDNARVHGRGAVTVAVRRSGVLIAIDVSDEGPDLDVDSHELFQRRELRDGHGIGLSFGRRLAEAEDARLVMTNRAPPTFSLIAATGPSTGFVPGDS
jgi:signal transduction histidine kinase